MTPKPSHLSFPFLAACALFASCTHTKVTTVSEASDPAGLTAHDIPPTIYVSSFATDAAQVQVDPGGPLKRLTSGEPLLDRQQGGLIGGLFNPHGDQTNPYQTSSQVSQVEMTSATNLQKDLVAQLRKAGIPATYAGQYQPGSVNSLLLTGQFLTIDEGEKSKRMVIGLGVGASYLGIQAQLRDMATPENPPILSFNSTGDSGMAPGALVSGGAGAAISGMGAASAGVSGLRASKTGTPTDIEHAAEQITTYLKGYYVKQGWLPPPQSSSTAATPPNTPATP